ncbi:hypothetical protein Taro_056889, partial [Colocasia esculenta]|nr:hypothetical protein [Colocasia esculenta]
MVETDSERGNFTLKDEILEVDKYHWLAWRGLLPVLHSKPRFVTVLP